MAGARGANNPNASGINRFTILTPFPRSPVRAKLEQEGRILSNDWSRYTADKVVFRPKRMTPHELQTMYDYAWDTFYASEGPELRMGTLFKKVIQKEIENGTYQRRHDVGRRRSFVRRAEA